MRILINRLIYKQIFIFSSVLSESQYVIHETMNNKKSKKDNKNQSNKQAKGQNKHIGRVGEATACMYLKGLGHDILAQNLVLKTGEIDILSYKNGVLHVVEVKSAFIKDIHKESSKRASVLLKNETHTIDPEESLSWLKLNKLRKLSLELDNLYPSSPLFDGILSDEVSNRQKIDPEGMVLRDSGGTHETVPVIQIDAITVRFYAKSDMKEVGRLKDSKIFSKDMISKVKIRYFPVI